MTVFVVQNPHTRDRKTDELYPRFDLTPAEAFGDLEFLVSPTCSPFRAEGPISEMRQSLSQFTDEDFLLPVGNACLSGMAVAIAAGANGGRVNMLQWSNKRQAYSVVEAFGL